MNYNDYLIINAVEIVIHKDINNIIFLVVVEEKYIWLLTIIIHYCMYMQ